jgi:2-polyprenyl-3-methyl-5-hydroxy-6-metoxy-1,4-benzoquinol methylase
MTETADIKSYYKSRYKSEQHSAFPCDIVRTSAIVRPVVERFTQGGKVLDFGCGPGYTCDYLLKHKFEVHGIDIAEEAIALAKQHVPQGHFTVLSENGTLPYPDAFFDAITCLGVLEHVVNPERLLKECCRVINPAGLAVFVVPNTLSAYFLFSSGTGQIYEKPRTYTEWKDLLATCQFSILEAGKDPGPTMGRNYSVTKNAKLIIHKFLNILPRKYTYQFIFVVAPHYNRMTS